MEGERGTPAQKEYLVGDKLSYADITAQPWYAVFLLCAMTAHQLRDQHFVQPLNLVAVPIRACACVRVGTNGMESA
jgi:glutathione S-transferase